MLHDAAERRERRNAHMRAYQRDWRGRNVERENQKERAYRAAHKDRINAQARARRKKDVEDARARERVQYAENPEQARERGRQYRERHPERLRARHRENARRWQATIDALKTAPCTDCGGTFPPECMDFDHVRGVKTMNINLIKTCTSRRFHTELAKCELVCANCHRIRTRRRARAGSITAAES